METLRPYTLGEILDRTAQLYRRNFLLFAGVAAAPTGLVVAVFVCGGALIGAIGIASRNSIPANTLMFLVALVIILVGIPIAVAATVFSHAGITRTAICAHLGQPLTIREALKGVLPQFWRYLWLLILQMVFAALIPGAVAGGVVALLAYFASLAGGGIAIGAMVGVFVFFIFAAAFVYIIWLALGYSMGMAACIVEGKSASDALHRSEKLSKGTRGRIFLMGLLVWALSIVISMIAYIPMLIVVAGVTAIGHGAEYATITTVAAEILNILINFALQTLVTPVYMTALVLFYYDQRVRTEGYDIELLMEQAGLTGGGAQSGLLPTNSAIESQVATDTVKGI